MPSSDSTLEWIKRELPSARQAFDSGNEGKGRVCARRAAGIALTWFLSTHPRHSWGTDAMTQLLHLKDDSSFPQDVREAASRLTARIIEQFSYPFKTSPLEDSNIIVLHIPASMGNAPD